MDYRCVILAVLPFLTSGVWIDIEGTQLRKALDYVETIQLPFDLWLFNQKYPPGTDFKISTNGYFSVGSDFEGHLSKMLPFSDISVDVVALVPYRARAEYRPSETLDTLGYVSYEIGLSEGKLAKLKTEVLKHSVEGSNFNIKNSLAIVWNELSFFSGNPAVTPYPRNTYELIILVDDSVTYAIFNYQKITWQGGYVAGGDVSTGRGANNPHPQAGFNLGGGKGFVKLAYGQNDILRLTEDRIGETKGVYVYRVSDGNPKPEGCVGMASDQNQLFLTPNSGPMFGGNAVVVNGICFDPDAKIQCQFGDKIVGGVIVHGGHSQALCYAPVFYEQGKIPFSLWINEAKVTTTPTYYLISVQIANQLKQENIDEWRSTEPSSLILNWNTHDITHHEGGLTAKLFVYYEDEETYGWQEELVIEENVPNTGQYELKLTNDSLCTENCHTKNVGSVVLELENPIDSDHPGRMWTNIGALGWYTNQNLTDEHGDQWGDQLCFDWFKTETRNQTDMLWLEELVECPCDMKQAMSDFGRFVPDPGCNIYRADNSNCYYHKSAQHCVRSIWPSYPTGAGVQCCYSDSGALMYAGDSIYGSTVDKSHNQGAKPYNKAGYIPSLSHWILDVVTYQYCCMWNLYNETCGIYMDQRPTKDCKNYHHSKPATLYGMGNIHTFDDVSYKLDTPGDHVILETTDGTKVHGRIRKADTKDIHLLTRVAIKGPQDEDDQVEIKLNRKSVSSSARMSIYVGGEEQSFRHQPWYIQEFKGVTVISWDQAPLTDHSSFLIFLPSGLGVRVSAGPIEYINLVISAPPEFKNMMNSAVLGTWDEDETNDSDPGVITSDLFSEAYATGTAPLTLTGSSEAPETVCGDNAQCLADYAAGGDSNIARDTKLQAEMFEETMESAVAVVSCGMPVNHAKRSGADYIEGGRTQIIGCRHGYALSGVDEEEHVCEASGNWTPPIDLMCNYVGFPRFEPVAVKLRPTYTPSLDHNALPLVIILSLLVISTFFIAGAAFWYRRRYTNLYETSPPTTPKKALMDNNENGENVGYTMSSQGSMKLTVAANKLYAEQMNAYTDEEGPVSPVRWYSSRESHDPNSPPFTSYRMAVDPVDSETNGSINYSRHPSAGSSREDVGSRSHLE